MSQQLNSSSGAGKGFPHPTVAASVVRRLSRRISGSLSGGGGGANRTNSSNSSTESFELSIGDEIPIISPGGDGSPPDGAGEYDAWFGGGVGVEEGATGVEFRLSRRCNGKAGGHEVGWAFFGVFPGEGGERQKGTANLEAIVLIAGAVGALRYAWVPRVCSS